MRKLCGRWLLVVIILLCLLLQSCKAVKRNKSLTENYPKKFGSTYMTMNNPYFHVLNDSIKDVVEANGDFLITRDPAANQEKQNDQIYEMIEEDVEAIFLNPVDWKAVEPALIACRKAGIPVFNVDTPVYKTEYVVSIIASDNYDAGAQCAEDMMEKLDKANIIILDEPKINSITQRMQGFLDTIEENDNYRVVIRKAAMGELEVAMEVMNEVLKSEVDFDVVMGGNDPTALGAVASIESRHIEKNILIYGVDGSPDGKKMIKDGYLEGSSEQTPSIMGTIAAEVVYNYLNGEKIEEFIVVPVTLITNENLDDLTIDQWQ